MTDQEIWQQLKRGDKSALEMIYREHIDALISYGLKFTSDQQIVEDAIQDLFIDIWRRKDTIGDTDAIRPYLLVSIRRRIVKILSRKNKHQVDISPDEVDFEVELAVDEIISMDEEADIRSQKIKQAFTQLSARQKEILYLKYYQNLDYDKICEVMDINYQSARNLVAKGIRALKKLMVWGILCVISIL